jgi:two-component system, NtrC family, sensor kinase
MESLPQAWASSHTVLMICFGISLYVSAFHLTLARRGHTANLWAALWALATAILQVARFAQLYAPTPADSVAAARLAVASFPVLVGGLAFVVRSLSGPGLSRRWVAAFAATTLAFAALAFLTPAFIADAPVARVDPLGRAYDAAVAGPAMPLIGVVLAVAFVGMVRMARALERGDRIILLASLGVYVSVGLAAVFQAHGVHSIPLVAGLGPAVTAIGLSHLVVGHERRRARTQAERGMQELAASEARLRELVERAPIGIISCDAAGHVRTVNPRMWQMFGAPEAVRRGPLGNLLEFELAQRPDDPQLVRRVLSTGETQTGEIRFAPTWGRPMQLRFIVTPLRAATGEISGALVLSEDVTERNELERRLRLAQKMEAVGQLAAGIAHEINTPMAYVRSNLRALHEDWNALRGEIRKDPGSETTTGLLAGAEALIDESLEGVERTIAIARDMREFAHSASAAREPTDLNHELETCVRLASTQHPGVAITESYGELPPVLASSGQLRQVFLNLIVNALQAVSASGNVGVSSAHEGDFASVRVRDDGCGIQRELQHRLFEPFFTTKPADRGTGLGLYISYQIVRTHGGEIRVDSTPGEGASFEVRLPLGRS